MTKENSKQLGGRLRALRVERGLTLEHLAGLCGLTRGYLSLVERDLKTPSIAALLRVTAALKADVGGLFNGRATASNDYVLYRHKPHQDVSYAIALAPGREGKTMEPFLISPPAKAIERFTHSGEELIVVLQGRVMIQLGEDELILDKNDSLYFTASLQHSIRSIGPVQAELLVVVGRLPAAP